MKKNFIILTCSLLILFSPLIIAQPLEINLETDKSEYMRDDSIFVTHKIKNISADTIIFLYKGRFHVEQKCFTAFHYGSKTYYKDDKENELGDFNVTKPGETIMVSDSMFIYWPCRSMPPRGDWTITLSYILEITENDNYYIIKTDGGKTKIPFEAWIGTASSDSVSFIIKKPGW